jgi:hypothetical protein
MSFAPVLCLALLLFAPGDDGENLASRYGFDGFEIYKVEGGVYGLALADLDGDGRDDFGFINNSRSKIELYIRLPDGAADEFDPADPDLLNQVTYDGRFRKESIAVEQEVLSLALGRFDSDGTVDAAFVTSTGELVVVFRGGERETPRESVKLDDFSPRRNGLISEDIDGDGVDDLIVLGEKKTILLRWGGEPVTLYNLQHKPGSFALGDFDGDGLKDMLYVYYKGEYPFMVRFQVAPGVFGPVATWKLEAVRAFTVTDSDGDGKDEILAVYWNSGRLARFGLDRGKNPRFRFFSLRDVKDSEKISITCADLDGDGKSALLIADAEAARVIVLDGFAEGEPVRRVEHPSLRGVLDPCVADIDGDGRRELVVISETEGVIGVSPLGKKIGFPRFVAVDGQPLALCTGDVTGDGIDDAVCVSTKGKGSSREFFLNVLCRSEGKESVSNYKIQKARDKKKTFPKTPRDLLLADVNRDGRTDVVVFMPGEVPAILFNRGKGQDVEIPFVASMEGDTPGMGLLKGARDWSVCPADVGGDGKIELAVASGNLARFIYFPEDGELPQAARQYNSPSPGEDFTGCAFADLIGGKEPELLLFENGSKTVRIVGSDDSLLAKLDASRLEFRGFETPDLNGDGKRDLLVRGVDRIGVWLAGEKCSILEEMDEPYESPDKDSSFLDVSAGDVNADGSVDAVLVDSGRKGLCIVTAGKAGLEHALKFRVFEEKLFHGRRGSSEPHGVYVHDLTGDGKKDVIVLVHDKIIIYPQG